MIAIPFAADWIAVRIPERLKTSKLLLIGRIILVGILWWGLFLATAQAPLWAKDPPYGWNRPCFLYGWPLPWKGEFAGMERSHLMPILLLADWLFWLFYSSILCRFRRLRHFAIIGIVAAVLFLLIFLILAMPR